MENRLEEFKDGWFDVALIRYYDKLSWKTLRIPIKMISIVFEKLPGWLKLIYSKMADNSHLYVLWNGSP